MRTGPWVIVLLVLGQFLASVSPCLAQAPDTPAANGEQSAEEPADKDAVEESKPQIYLLPDEQGKLQRILGFTYEAFMRLQALETERTGPPRPRYTLDRLSVNGQVEGELARLVCQLTVTLREKHWVRIPLEMGEAVLGDDYKPEGDDEFIEYDDAQHEYVAWLHGETEKPRRLTLSFLVTIEQVAGRRRLKFVAPRAAYSELRLVVPTERAVAEVSPSAVVDGVRPAQGGSEFKVLGLSSDFSLSWHESVEQVAKVSAVLQAKGDLLARIDGRSVHTEATLTTSSFGGEFNHFLIRLPRGATLTSAALVSATPTGDEPPGGTVTAVSGGAGAGEPRLVEVQLKGRTTGPATVRLTTEQAHDVGKADELLDLGGFEVLGAVRQWGYVAVQVDGDWQVSFGGRQRVRQVDDLPAGSRRDDVVATFEYYGQPYSLPVRILPRKTLLSVEPRYVAQVGADRVELTAQFKYRIGGAKVFDFQFDFSGWEVDLTRIDPKPLVNAAAVVLADGARLTVPLKQAGTGEVELTVRAQQPVPPGAQVVEFRLPRPTAESVGAAELVELPSELVILPADNVELTSDEAKITRLSRQRLRGDVPLPPHQREPLFYRSETGEARYAAAMHVLARRISVAVHSRVNLESAGAKVEEKLMYTIAHEPIDALLLEVPRELAEKGQIEIRLGDQPLVVETETDDDPQRAVRKRVKLPEKRIGTCELSVSYPWGDGQPPPPGASRPVDLPLVMPAEGECTENSLIVSARPGVQVAQLDKTWTAAAETSDDEAGDDVLRLTASGPQGKLMLGMRGEEPRGSGEVVVDRAWIRTWFTPRQREDRAVFHFTTRRNHFKLKLPGDASGVQFLVDGRRATSREEPSGEVSVSWKPSALGEHVLEASYQCPVRGSGRGAWELALPEVGSGVAVRRTYWQLVLPRDELLLGGPAEMTPESSWGWRGFYWGRRPLLDQVELERWSGAAAADGLPQATNRYLFSTTQPGASLSIRTAGLSLLVLVASGAVLAIGLLLIYVPLLRHPSLLLVAAVALLAGAWIDPDLTLTGLQAAVLGLALTIVAIGLEGGISRRQDRLPRPRGGSSSIVGRSSTRTQPHVSQAAPASTETAAVAVELSAPEARP